MAGKKVLFKSFLYMSNNYKSLLLRQSHSQHVLCPSTIFNVSQLPHFTEVQIVKINMILINEKIVQTLYHCQHLIIGYYHYRRKLLTGTLPVNYSLLTRTVPVNNSLFLVAPSGSSSQVMRPQKCRNFENRCPQSRIVVH